jgi:hypothetical protein
MLGYLRALPFPAPNPVYRGVSILATRTCIVENFRIPDLAPDPPDD